MSSIIKQAQQRMDLLHQLRKFNQPQVLMLQCYTATVESIITSSIMLWESSATKENIHRLHDIIRLGEKKKAEKTTWVEIWICTTPEPGIGWRESFQFHHTLVICSGNFSQAIVLVK